MYWYFGFNLEYRFGVAIVTITWITLLISSAMLNIFFRRCSLDVAGETGGDR
jgi:membrane associated rhomboid family serine protease